MKSKQVLDVQQMQHLQELGLDTSNATMCWIKVPGGRELAFNDAWMDRRESYLDPIPAYTLQDVLDLLPDFIDNYVLVVDMGYGVVRYDNLTKKNKPILKETYFNDEERRLIDAAFEMLCWIIENNYYKKDKEDE